MLLLYTLKDKIRKNPFLQKRSFLYIIGLSLLINVFLWYSIYSKFRLHILQQGIVLVPLHYNIYLGPDYFAPFHYVYGLPLLGILSLLVNTFLAMRYYQRMSLLAYYLIGTVFLLHIMLAAALYLIIKFNV